VEAILVISRPSAFHDVCDEEYASLVAKELQRRERKVRSELRRVGGHFMGADRLRNISPFYSPRTEEKSFRLNPKVAGHDRERRLVALRQYRAFVLAYHDAMQKYKEGVHDVVFPAGTYWMHRVAGVACACPG
jgi:hypothetical protein